MSRRRCITGATTDARSVPLASASGNQFVLEFPNRGGFGACGSGASRPMPSKRYTIIVADRESGEVRRGTVAARPVVAVLALFLLLPTGWANLSRWATQAEINSLRSQNARLQVESASYRTAATDLTAQLAVLQSAIDNLEERTDAGAPARVAVDRLPAAVTLSDPVDAPLPAPGPTFERLRNLLTSLEGKLAAVRHSVAVRETLAAATPTIWPADGWVSSGYGYRNDPFTGDREFHSAIDISTRSGQPVRATANGLISIAGRNGHYGNMVEITHGFDLTTRYGHLSAFAVGVGDTVQRGDIIGYAGATGRATGYHVHYEVAVNGRTINPLRLLSDADPLAAN